MFIYIYIWDIYYLDLEKTTWEHAETLTCRNGQSRGDVSSLGDRFVYPWKYSMRIHNLRLKIEILKRDDELHCLAMIWCLKKPWYTRMFTCRKNRKYPLIKKGKFQFLLDRSHEGPIFLLIYWKTLWSFREKAPLLSLSQKISIRYGKHVFLE